MKKEEILLIAQLLTGMRDAVARLELAQKENNIEEINIAKRTILDFQEKIDSML